MTKPIRIAIADATDVQLREFAANSLGLEVHHLERGENLMAKILAAWDKDFIMVTAEGEDKPADPSPDLRLVDDVGSEKTIIVRIQVTEQVDGNEPVPIGVNGRVMLVPRDRWCRIPYPYFEVLQHAVEARYDPLADGGYGPARRVPRYPHETWSGAGAPPDLLEPPSKTQQASAA